MPSTLRGKSPLDRGSALSQLWRGRALLGSVQSCLTAVPEGRREPATAWGKSSLNRGSALSIVPLLLNARGRGGWVPPLRDLGKSHFRKVPLLHLREVRGGRDVHLSGGPGTCLAPE